MILLKIDNSESKIEGLLVSDHKKLKDLLSYVLNPGASYFSGGYGPKKQSLLSAKGVFPTGLLYIVQEFLQSNKIKVVTKDLRVEPKRQEGLFTLVLEHSPYPSQKQAVDQAIKAKRGIIVAPTGVGKSLIVTLLIDRLQVPTLVIVPSLELKRQLSETLSKAFGADKVGVNKPIYVENVDSLRTKKNVKKYDAVIIDEFHHSGAKTYRKLNKTLLPNTFFKFGTTATPFRSQDNEKLLLESVLSKVVSSITYEEAVQNGHIVPMEAYYVELPKVAVKGNTWPTVFKELVVENEIRNAIITSILKSLDDQGISTICLIKEIRHGEILSEASGMYFASGVNEDTPHLITLFNRGTLKTLIGTTGVIGEGVDTKPAEFIIIAGLGKSRNAFMQNAGRGFRKYKDKESCKIIIFKDLSHKWSRDHYKTQCKILLEEYGITPSKLDIKLTVD